MMRKTSLIFLGAIAGAGLTLLATQPPTVFVGSKAASSDTYRQLNLSATYSNGSAPITSINPTTASSSNRRTQPTSEKSGEWVVSCSVAIWRVLRGSLQCPVSASIDC
jgi:hypothetical protein